MRKIFIGLVILIFTGTLCFLVTALIKKVQKKNLLSEKISKLPSFSFNTLDNEKFNSSDIKRGPVLVVRFHPDCEHCKYEISEIFRSDIPVSGSTIILISSANSASVKRFLNSFNYKNFPSVVPLSDTARFFDSIFGNEVIPTNYIYNNKLDLVKEFRGEVKTEAVLKYLSDVE